MDSRNLLEQILKTGKPAYGTSEYWEKERKSKYQKNARHQDNIEKQIAEGIISMWAMTPLTDPPLLKLSDIRDQYKPMNDGKEGDK